jgi:hypothetical protein
MLSILKLKNAIDAANETTQPRQAELAVALRMAMIALEESGEQCHKFGARWIAAKHRNRAAELAALTLSAK